MGCAGRDARFEDRVARHCEWTARIGWKDWTGAPAARSFKKEMLVHAS